MCHQLICVQLARELCHVKHCLWNAIIWSPGSRPFSFGESVFPNPGFHKKRLRSAGSPLWRNPFPESIFCWRVINWARPRPRAHHAGGCGVCGMGVGGGYITYIWDHKLICVMLTNDSCKVKTWFMYFNTVHIWSWNMRWPIFKKSNVSNKKKQHP